MNYHYIPETCRQQSFQRLNRPCLEIESGDIVTFQTSDDAYARLAAGESPDEIPDEDYNIVTGPVVVHGAEPGDCLRIEIMKILIRRAWSVWIPGYGPFGHLTDQVCTEKLLICDGWIRISDRLRVPLAPMIGCIGLSPAAGIASTLEPAYPFGGNLDLRELSPGATLLLPVQTTGGWLSVGDLHAAMGVGEPSHIALEASGEVTVRLSIEKERRLTGPLVLLPQATLLLAIQGAKGTLEQAVQVATEFAFEMLIEKFGMNLKEAHAYLSARMNLRFGGPASLPRSSLKSLIRILSEHHENGRNVRFSQRTVRW